ncbi:MAG: MBL fold metallo-hydrolase [Chloroflexi bacterium]|nr:MBL fold metallo-hydrolase [Chloroflexota bacterium]
MSQLSRRHFLKFAGIAGAAAAGSSLLPGITRPAHAQMNPMEGMQGTVLITPTPAARLHTYVAPDSSNLVTSHIIETDNQLVLVDVQQLRPFAAELAAYVDSLGKPVERIYLSHEHPDHWLGAENFDAPFISTDAIAAGVQATIDANTLPNVLPPEVLPDTYIVPTGGLTAGSETIDGVTFEFEIVGPTEAPEQIVFRLPEARTVILQDLLYNNAHVFPLAPDLENWVAVLEGLRGLTADGYQTMLPGHGYPTTFGEIEEAIAYLNFMGEAIATSESFEEFSNAVTTEFPGYGGTLYTFAAALFA